MNNSFRINISAPNIVNVCIDETTGNEGIGRLYCRYKKDAIAFTSVYKLIKLMDDLMNKIGFPQAAVEERSYQEQKAASGPYWRKTSEIKTAVSDNSFIEERGKIATFIIYVQYRQNATWQGEAVWVEGDRQQFFKSELELLKFIESTFVEIGRS